MIFCAPSSPGNNETNPSSPGNNETNQSSMKLSVLSIYKEILLSFSRYLIKEMNPT